jgi:cysteine desulfurase
MSWLRPSVDVLGHIAQQETMDDTVYLDHNATTPLRPEAREAIAAALLLTGNPSSVHRYGRLARRTVEDARDSVAALVGAHRTEVVFTSGGTEANAMAIAGSGRPRILVSAVEHLSVLRAVDTAETIPVDGDGVIDLNALEAMLTGGDRPTVVSVMLANNETGVVQPIAAVAEIARRYGALIHCDAVQAAGRIRVDFGALGVHMMSLSAHKIGGPSGVGALIVAEGVSLNSRVRGGGQERGLRAGTENVPGIAGFGAAADAALRLADAKRWEGLRERLELRLREGAPQIRVFGADVERLPNTSCLSMPGVASDTQVMALDLAGIAVGAGSACSSGKVTPSHVLKAMGLAERDTSSAIRVSLGWNTADADIERFVESWSALFARLGAGGNQAVSAA